MKKIHILRKLFIISIIALLGGCGTKSTDPTRNLPSEIPLANEVPSETPTTTPLITPSVAPSETPITAPPVTPNVIPSETPIHASTDTEYSLFDKCTMEIVENTITPAGLTLRFASTSENETIYGDYYRVDKYDNDEWKALQYLEQEGEVGWNSIAYIVPQGGSSEAEIDWAWLYGELAPGKYRVVKDVMDFRGTGDYDTYYLAAVFTIE